MCGRFTQHHNQEEVIERFGIQETLFDIKARFNIAPSQQIAAVCQEEKRVLTSYKWGLVPYWSKDAQIGNKLINARAETLAEKPSFKKSLLTKRCLIPADGFYEWKQEGKHKTPVYVCMKSKALFAFAGLWDEWKSPESKILRTCTIITVEPNPLISKVHHRMAAILRPKDEELWLDPTVKDLDKLLSLLKTYPEDEMEFFAVNKEVNNTNFDSPVCIEPLDLVKKMPLQETLW
ncbi:MAG: SOS response-associated peptidase [Acidobacteria bacterium]|nr:SOS response-associated peptidase [Acidobacteriota bacterium]